jgi:hypothetical protein
MAGAALDMRKVVSVAVLAMLPAAWQAPASAAVRLCEASVSSGQVIADKEMDARKGALDAWKAKARQHGEGYASWRLAGDKFLECLPRNEGGFECIAKGAPCTIEQAPDRRELRKNRIDT